MRSKWGWTHAYSTWGEKGAFENRFLFLLFAKQWCHCLFTDSRWLDELHVRWGSPMWCMRDGKSGWWLHVHVSQWLWVSVYLGVVICVRRERLHVCCGVFLFTSLNDLLYTDPPSIKETLNSNVCIPCWWLSQTLPSLPPPLPPPPLLSLPPPSPPPPHCRILGHFCST